MLVVIEALTSSAHLPMQMILYSSHRLQQHFVDIYAGDLCISFSSLDTKCVLSIPKERRDISAHVDNLEFFIDDKLISFAKSFFHVGHLIKSNLSDDDDIVKRWNDFIGQLNNNLCYYKKNTLTRLV